MPETCPHCGTAQPETTDAYCPECRQDLAGLPFDYAPTAAAARAAATQPPTPPYYDQLEYGGVRITAVSLIELDGCSPLLTVKRSDIQRVTLRWGWQSRRALGLLLFAAIVMVPGIMSVLAVVTWLNEGGKLSTLWALGTTLNIIAGWAVYDALKRGFFLETVGPNGRQRLCFRRRANRSKIDELLAEAERRFGYQFDRHPTAVP